VIRAVSPILSLLDEPIAADNSPCGVCGAAPFCSRDGGVQYTASGLKLDFAPLAASLCPLRFKKDLTVENAKDAQGAQGNVSYRFRLQQEAKNGYPLNFDTPGTLAVRQGFACPRRGEKVEWSLN